MSGAFQTCCGAIHVTQSMGCAGNCWQNAVAESFFSHMKIEMFYQRSRPTRLEMRAAMLEYIEIWFNRQRPHRRAGGISPTGTRPAYQASDHAVAA
ncbi:MAG: IS3 family transposase [Nakamurella sp.]